MTSTQWGHCYLGSKGGGGELLGLWIILFIAKQRGIASKQIVWDSSLIINWANELCTIQSMHICFWLQNARALLMDYPHLSLIHIH